METLKTAKQFDKLICKEDGDGIKVMFYFSILQTPVESWYTIAGADADTLTEIRAKLRGFITEIDAGHQGQRYFGIWINPAFPEPEQLMTIGHELAHLDKMHLDKYGLRNPQAEAEAARLADQYAKRFQRGDFDAWNIKRHSANQTLQIF